MFLLALCSIPGSAQVTNSLKQLGALSRLSREAAESVLQKYGNRAVNSTAGQLASRIEQYAVRHGQEFIQAIRAVGPQAFKVLDDVGSTQASRAMRIMTAHGEKGIVHILTRPQALQVATRVGAKAESALLKHPGIAENVMERFGEPAAHALNQLGPQAGRRLAMLHESGELVKLGRTEEVLKVIGTYGDKAMQFIWKHKGALAVSSSLAVFLSEPEAVLNGTVTLVSTLATPIVEIPRNVATEAARSLNWTWVVTLVIAVLAGMWFLKQRMSLIRR